MSDPFEPLGALARSVTRAPVSTAVDELGKQRLLARARTLPRPRASLQKPAWVWGLAAAAGIALSISTVEYVRSRPINYEVVGGATVASDYLSASVDKPVDVNFTDGTKMHAEAGTRLRIDDRRSNGARVLVERGMATANVTHTGKTSWRFVAGPFEVHVIGTRLTLGWDPVKEEVDLVLHEGAVEVESPLAKGRFPLRAGQRYRASLIDGSTRIESLSPTGKVVATTETKDTVEAKSLAELPLAAAAPANDSKPAHAKANGGPSSAEANESWPDLVRRGRFAAVVAAAKSRGLTECLNSCSATDVRALADAARYAGESSLAEKSLQTLRDRFGSTGQGVAAAFLLGRLNESRGQLGAADRWYQTYLQEAPGGQFAADALAGRMRSVSTLQGPSAGKPLALEYLRKYPDGVQAPAARKLGGFD